MPRKVAKIETLFQTLFPNSLSLSEFIHWHAQLLGQREILVDRDI